MITVSLRPRKRGRWSATAQEDIMSTRDEPRRPKVLVLSPYFPPAELSGGPARTLEAMVAQATEETRTNIALLTSAHELRQRQTMDVPLDRWVRRHDILVRYTRGGALWQFIGVLRTRSLKPRAVYLNSFFHPAYSLGPAFMARLAWWSGAKLVIAPRGEFNPGPLSTKAPKKRAVLFLAKSFHVYDDVLWHASTRAEALDIRKVFPNAEVFVAENETLLGDHPPRPERPGPARRIAYLSRISPQKGLHRLLEAATTLTSPLHIDVFGNEEDSAYAAHCHAIADALPPHIGVNFLGVLPHDEVVPTLTRYDLMALPTASENFGHAISEALFAGCPVMLPPTTPWTKAARATQTLVEGLEIDLWKNALSNYANLSIDDIMEKKKTAQLEYVRWQQERGHSISALDLLVRRRTPEASRNLTQGGCAP